jgi:heme-degrading monooxygenase HmoA
MALLLGALAAAFVLVGCGADEDSAQISKSAFVNKGSAICIATRRGIRSDFEAFTKGSEGKEVERAEKANELTPEEAAERVGEEIVIPAMRQELAEFRALGVPPGGEDEVIALLKAFEEGVDRAEGDPEGAATDGTEAFGESGKVAEAYGLEGC